MKQNDSTTIKDEAQYAAPWTTTSTQDETKVLNDPLLEPWTYLRSIPGKNVRGKLIDAFQHWLQTPEDKVILIRQIVGHLHEASLLIDDIEDNSELRRGEPVAHHIYGIPTTINCANYVYFIALSLCNELNSKEAIDIYSKEMIHLHQGQGLDILWRETDDVPTEGQYKEMVLNKTGGLFRLSVGLLQIFSTCTREYDYLVEEMSLYFQIRDDYINLASAKYMEHKSFCEDLTEGKLSFPIIFAIRKDPQDRRLRAIIKQHTKKLKLKQHALQYIINTGALEYTRQVLDKLEKSIKNEIAALGGNPPLEKLMMLLHTALEGPENELTPEAKRAKTASFPFL